LPDDAATFKNFGASAGSGPDHWSLALEVAHYLGLAHPHSAPEFRTIKESGAFFVPHGNAPEIFDGDGLKDASFQGLIWPIRHSRP
jgi:hypothetical protein